VDGTDITAGITDIIAGTIITTGLFSIHIITTSIIMRPGIPQEIFLSGTDPGNIITDQNQEMFQDAPEILQTDHETELTTTTVTAVTAVTTVTAVTAVTEAITTIPITETIITAGLTVTVVILMIMITTPVIEGITGTARMTATAETSATKVTQQAMRRG